MKKIIQIIKNWLSRTNRNKRKKRASHSATTITGKSKIVVNETDTLLLQVETFLQQEYEFRFNQLTEVTEFRKRSSTNEPFKPVGKRELNSLCIATRKNGINCWDRDIQRYVHSEDIPTYHPFHTYMDNLPTWDGTDRVSLLAQRISSNQLWIDGFHKWMLGMTVQWMGIQSLHGNSISPVLVSQKQGKHKSTFCRMLVPDELQGYYTDSFDLTALSASEQKLALFGLINLDELDKFSDRKMALLKNLMQMAGINVRKAYKRNFSALPRIASFIATSNRKELLTDPTGSRRFLCVEIEDKISDAPIEHAQLYSQLKSEIFSGVRYWFTEEEEKAIMENNASFQRRSMAEDVFHLCYEIPKTDEDYVLLSAAQMFTYMKKQYPSAMRDASEASFSKTLTALGVKRIHSYRGNLYKVKSIS